MSLLRRKCSNIGRIGEEMAAEYLSGSGFEVLGRNVRTPFGEIDIVALRGGVIYFIEVKTRRGRGFGTALEAVTGRKRERLVSSAHWFLSQGGVAFKEVSFAAVGIEMVRSNPEFCFVELDSIQVG